MIVTEAARVESARTVGARLDERTGAWPSPVRESVAQPTGHRAHASAIPRLVLLLRGEAVVASRREGAGVAAVATTLSPRLSAASETVPLDALQRAARFFRTFGEDYHERQLEEAHIFPMLKRPGGPASKAVDPLIWTSPSSRLRRLRDHERRWSLRRWSAPSRLAIRMSATAAFKCRRSWRRSPFYAGSSEAMGGSS